MARVLQSTSTRNQAEQRVLDLLRSLPDDTSVLCELRLVAAWQEQTGHLRDRQPDFVVLSPSLGLVIIETKDWNLQRSYRWLNQREVQRADGQVIDNPWHQAYTYGKAMQSLIRGDVWVTSLVAFPRLNSAQFWNAFSIPAISSQGQALLDPNLTVFGDDVDAHPDGLAGVLHDLVRRAGSFRVATPRQIETALRQLIPAKYVIGAGQERHDKARRQLHTLTEQQQAWAFGLEPGPHAIIDLAGSGKTNVLVSRALHLVEQAAAQGQPYRVLVLTYGETLRRHIRLMLQEKLDGGRLPAGTAIDVLDVDSVLQHIVVAAYGLSEAALAAEVPPSLPPIQRSRKLLELFREVGRGLGDLCRWYDAILIDEVEDFARVTPALIEVLHRGKELLLVGDLAQRFGEHPMDFQRLRLDAASIRVEPRYAMYRCPPDVAQLAHRFAYADPLLRGELGAYGYTAQPSFAGPVKSLPEFRHFGSRIEGDGALAETVQTHLNRSLPLAEIMVIAAPSALDGACRVLTEAGFPVKDRPARESAILVVGLEASKGLEATGVVLWGVDQITCEPACGPAATPDQRAQALSHAKRLVYVGLTRTTHYLTVLYQDSDHRLMRELLNLRPTGPEVLGR